MRRLLRKSSSRPSAPLLPDTLTLAHGPVPLTVRRNPRAKRLILRLAPGADGLIVTAPQSASVATILDFLERNRGWAEARVAARPVCLVVEHDAVLPFRDGTLRVRHAPGRRATLIERGAAGEAVLHVGGEPAAVGRRVMDALKREARKDLQAAVDRHAAAVGIKPAALTLKDTRSRWGSCSHDRRLAFSWRIVMAPPEVLDYLAAHEVAHLREMNHGPKFWALCRELCPGMDAGRDWLRSEGGALHAIRFG
ncbi:M48 family metallopeptidase [Aurantimonas sp. MSK8Z-1]|uniref:M48 family metallopeptidase n=1 Tax=Mangrovibrevibacter kandeliae TaxID=2968473 RepID=UPI00211760A1|nr:SprT family zinc-dependent metalloprotease [Aurantimonas sp. MSK8Z-1]MCW4115117.1 M48 family metallopeptidase [Aurantimonas sp. MSK8Z-1]